MSFLCKFCFYVSFAYLFEFFWQIYFLSLEVEVRKLIICICKSNCDICIVCAFVFVCVDTYVCVFCVCVSLSLCACQSVCVCSVAFVHARTAHTHRYTHTCRQVCLRVNTWAGGSYASCHKGGNEIVKRRITDHGSK